MRAPTIVERTNSVKIKILSETLTNIYSVPRCSTVIIKGTRHTHGTQTSKKSAPKIQRKIFTTVKIKIYISIIVETYTN